MDSSNFSSSTEDSGSARTSGVETLGESAESSPRLTTTTNRSRIMNAIPGGPPMASGSSGDPTSDQSENRASSRPRGTRVQLFADVLPQSAANNLAPDGNAAMTSSASKAPPPDVIVQMRRPDLYSTEDGAEAESAMAGFNPSMTQRSAGQRSMSAGQRSAQMVDLSLAEGQESLHHQSTAPVLMARPDLDVSLGIGSESHNLYEELRTAMVGQNAGPTTGSGNNPSMHIPVFPQSVAGAVGNVDSSNMRILESRDHRFDQQQHESPLEDRAATTGDESMESGMYNTEQGDLSEEFLPLENEDPEGAGSSENEDLDYEDNTEVDQDVVLQPEADQTTYDEDINDEVEDHESRQVNFLQQQQLRGNGTAPIFSNQQHLSGSAHQQHLMPAGYNRVGDGGHNVMHLTSASAVGNFHVHQQLQHGELQASQRSLSAGSRRFAQQQQQQSANTTEARGEAENDSDLAIGDTNPGNMNPEEDQVSYQQDSQTTSQQQRPTQKQNQSHVQQNLQLQPQQLSSRQEQSPSADKVPKRDTEKTPKDSSDRSKSSSASSGTNAGRQHGGAIPKVQKGATTTGAASREQPAQRRNKIRTLPPKVSTAASVTRSGSKLKTASKTKSSKTSSSSQQQAKNRSGVGGKSQSRAPPPERLAPSGGDSSTAGPPFTAQGQGQIIQSGHYVLPPPQAQVAYQPHHGQQPINIQVPSRDHNHEGADGILRPNPIGETGHNTNNNVQTLRQYDQNVRVMGHMTTVDGDGDESGQSQVFYRQIPGTAAVQWIPGAAGAAYSIHPAPANQQPLGHLPPNQHAVGHPATNPHPAAYSTNFYTQHGGVDSHASTVAAPGGFGYPPQHPLGTNLSIGYGFIQPNQGLIQASNLPNQPHHHQHEVVQRTASNDTFGAWDRSLELSPISRASGVTDRVQLTMQGSPSIATSTTAPSSGRDTAIPSRDGSGPVNNQNNTSFGSGTTLSDRTAQSDSTALTTDIVNMEQLRGQIHNMLRMTGQVLPDKATYDQTNGGSSTPGAGRAEDTSGGGMLAAGSRVLSDLAPEFDSLLNASSSVFLSDAGAGHSQGLLPDLSSLRADNHSLRETLEKEKYRRKHCEKQIADLQTRGLELQQQLAVAVSTDRKKDIMIEQLDKTLVQVVESWKKKEADKQQTMISLQQENAEMRRKQQQQQELLDRFERDLTETVDQLAQEQQRSKVKDDEQTKTIESQHGELVRLSAALDAAHQRATSLDTQCCHLETEADNTRRRLGDLQQNTEMERDSWDEKEQEYLQKIDEITKNHLSKMDDEKTRYTEQSQALQELQRTLSTNQNDVQAAQLELDSATREKESLKVQMGLLEAKSENQLRKLQAELQAQFETQLTERLDEDAQQTADREHATQERHRRQIAELTQRHATEAEAQLTRHQGELRRADEARRRELRDRDDKIELLQQELDDLRTINKRLEQQRAEMTVKLQSMMQSHCNEALRLLQVGGQALGLTGKDINLGPLYSGISSLRPPDNQSSASTGVSMATTTHNSMVTTATTSVTMAGLRSSILEAVTSSEPTDLANNVQRYLSSLASDEQTRRQSRDTSARDETLPESDHGTLMFEPLSEVLNQTTTSDLTQVPLQANQSPPSVLNASHFSSVSSAALPKTQQQQQLPPIAESYYSQDSKLMSLLQSLPSASSANVQSNSSQSLNQSIPQPSVSYSSSFQPISTRSTNGPTIMLHPPVQRDHITMATTQLNTSLQSTGSGGSGNAQMPFGIGQPADGSHFEPLAQHNMSMNTTASSDWGYPSAGTTTTGSLLSHILQQHLTPDHTGGTPRHDGKAGGAEGRAIPPGETSDLADVSSKFEQHETRQTELQHYIRMLLHRSPGNSEPGSQETSAPPDQVTPQKPTKSVAFSKTTMLGAPGGPAVTMTTSVPDPSAVLSPHQVSEISRLLGLSGYQPPPTSQSQGSSGTDQSQGGDLLTYLRNLQAHNQSLSSPTQVPVRDTRPQTPPSPRGPHNQLPQGAGPRGAGAGSPTRPAVQSRAKKNLEQTYQAPKHVIKIPTAAENNPSSHNAPQRQTNVATAPRQASGQSQAREGGAGARSSQSQPRQGGVATTTTSAAAKKVERKTATQGKGNGKGGVWK